MNTGNPEAAESCRKIAAISLDLAKLWEQAAEAAQAGDQERFNTALASIVVKDVALYSAHNELALHWERTAGGGELGG